MALRQPQKTKSLLNRSKHSSSQHEISNKQQDTSDEQLAHFGNRSGKRKRAAGMIRNDDGLCDRSPSGQNEVFFTFENDDGLP
jgi:hypothetical protein